LPGDNCNAKEDAYIIDMSYYGNNMDIMKEHIKNDGETNAGKFENRLSQMSQALSIPRIQIVTAEQLLANPIPVHLPNTAIDPFRKPDIKKNAVIQDEIVM
jgi:hypothetical protein